MHAKNIPYIVGGFMLLPYGFWLLAWGLFLPGPKYGFDLPMSVAMFAVTLPLVAWFFLANLGFMSNSIAGEDAFERPAGRWVRWTLARLPALALLLGAASVPYLLALDEPPLLIPLPVLVALLIAWAIDRGEAARSREVIAAAPGAKPAPARSSGALTQLGRLALAAVFLVPVIGWLLREAVQGSDEDRTYFALNLAMLAALAVLVFGFQALFVIAMICVPITFLLILLMTLG